jgi:hypothetical protein
MTLPTIDTRGWVALGLFALTAAVLGLIAWKPDLTDNAGFMVIAQAIVISGLISVVNYLFGSSKGATDVRDQLGQVISKLPDPDAKP